MKPDPRTPIDLDRRTLLSMAAGAAASSVAVAATGGARQAPAAPLRPNEAGPFDWVIVGGRVVDPETGLDAVRHVGVKGARIAAISASPLQGARTLSAEGQVVAPGFIDLHSHAQQLPAAWMQAFDGVTTALDLESGLLPVARFYEDVAREGRPIHYGVSAAWIYARIAEKEQIEPEANLVWFQRAFALNNWQNTLATPAELQRIVARVEAGLAEGGLGIGINAGYAPGYGRREYFALAQLAARHDVPTFTHVRYISVKEPQSAFEALEELVALSAATGAHMHVCHLNSSAGRDIEACAALLLGAQARGLPISVEAYPYGAGSSTIGAELYRGSDWLERWGVKDASALEHNGVPLTQQTIDELQKAAPGTVVVMNFLRPDQDKADRRLLDLSVLYPGAAIASDALPWLQGPRVIEGDVWPLPEGAFAHPRAAGCYARFISRWVRERQAVSLLEGVRRTSLTPAQVLEHAVPQMRKKGRLQVGADADIVVFDLARIRDNATFIAPAQPSSGMRHVVVAGTPIIVEGQRQAQARPGMPVRRKI